MSNFFKIENERIEQILPIQIKKSDVLSNNAKRVFAALLDLHFSLDNVKKQGFVFLSNDELRKITQIQKNAMLTACKELTELEHPLIKREVGKTRKKGEKATATKYYIIWNNINKPLKKMSFESLYKMYLNTAEIPTGTVEVDTDKDIDLDIDKDIDKDLEIDLDIDKNIDKNNNIKKEIIIKENETIEEFEKPIEIKTISENDFERNEKSFERNYDTNFENNSISTSNEKQYFNTLKELNQQNTFNSVLQGNNNNSNSNNTMNKETLQKEIEQFNGFENELFKCSSHEQVEALREKLYDWFVRITDNNSKVLKTEYLVTIKQFVGKLDTKSEKLQAAEQTDNSNNKALNTHTTAIYVQGEQIPSNDNFKPTDGKENANYEQANKITPNETKTKENQLQIELNESKKAGNNPRNSYTVQCGELQSQGNVKPTERLEMPLNEKSETVTDAVNMIETYEERINMVESVESVERLYTNCKNYFKKWSERYLESLNNDEIEFVKNKYKQMVNSKNDRLSVLKFKMVHNYN